MEINSFNMINSDYMQNFADKISFGEKETDSFSAILSSLMNGINETNELQHAAESAEIQFALGESDNTHDLLIATSKASVALQYTVAVRDKIVEGYNQIMQMQV